MLTILSSWNEKDNQDDLEMKLAETKMMSYIYVILVPITTFEVIDVCCPVSAQAKNSTLMGYPLMVVSSINAYKLRDSSMY